MTSKDLPDGVNRSRALQGVLVFGLLTTTGLLTVFGWTRERFDGPWFLVLAVVVIGGAALRLARASHRGPDDLDRILAGLGHLLLVWTGLLFCAACWGLVSPATEDHRLPAWTSLWLPLLLAAIAGPLAAAATRRQLEGPGTPADAFRRFHRFAVRPFAGLGVASFATGLTLLLLGMPASPIPGSVTARLLDRGLVPPLTLIFFFWSLALTVGKWRNLARERRARSATMAVVRDAQRGNEGPANLTLRLDTLRRFLYPERLLLHLAAPDPSGDTLAREAELDRLVLRSSHTYLRYIIWAMPVLGFLGTVLGISDAVAGLTDLLGVSGNAGADPQLFQRALRPLSLAFDTTLVALAASLVSMYLASVTAKAEDDLVAETEVLSALHLPGMIRLGREPVRA